MNKYYQKFKEPQPSTSRDSFFHSAIKNYFPKDTPAKILSIGATYQPDDMQGGGWGDFYFAEYLKNHPYGGELDICDIDKKHLKNCQVMTRCFIDMGVNIYYFLTDGINCIDDFYDVIYLDGDDDPKSMLAQFEKIDRTKTVVLCDDFHAKGSLLSAKYDDFVLYQVNQVHQCAVYPKINS